MVLFVELALNFYGLQYNPIVLPLYDLKEKKQNDLHVREKSKLMEHYNTLPDIPVDVPVDSTGRL